MSAVLIDGFEATGFVPTFQRRWNSAQSPAFGVGRHGAGKALVWSGPGALTMASRALPSLRAAYLIGAALRVGGTDAESQLFRLDLGSAEQVSLWCAPEPSSGRFTLEVRRTVEVLATATDALPPSEWAYIEWKVEIDDTAGRFELRVDQIPVLERTGIDTQAQGGSSEVDQLVVALNPGTAGELRLDDLYLARDAWDALEFWGVTSIAGVQPNADGATQEWTPSPGGSAFAAVDEDDSDDDASQLVAPASGPATYLVGTSVPVSRELVAGPVRAVGHTVESRVDASENIVAPAVLSDPLEQLDAEGDAVAGSSTDYEETATAEDLAPLGTPWERQEADRAEFGVRLP